MRSLYNPLVEMPSLGVAASATQARLAYARPQLTTRDRPTVNEVTEFHVTWLGQCSDFGAHLT